MSLSPGALWLFPLPGSAGLEEIADADADVESLTLELFDAQTVRNFVALLPDRERSVVQLRYGLTGMVLSCRQTGDFLDLPASTVHDAEQRALALLRQWYDDAGLAPRRR